MLRGIFRPCGCVFLLLLIYGKVAGWYLSFSRFFLGFFELLDFCFFGLLWANDFSACFFDLLECCLRVGLDFDCEWFAGVSCCE